VKAEVAIVGNGVAGYACAARLARHGIRPLLIGPGLPVDRPPLTKQGLAAGAPVLLADEKRLDDLGIDRLDAMVDEADLVSGRLVAGGAEIDVETIVLATGLSYRPPRIPGLEAAHVNATPRGMMRLVDALADGPKRVVVVGAGLIGTETAATLAVAGHDVTAIDLLDRPLDRLHEPLSRTPARASSAAPSSPRSPSRMRKQRFLTRTGRSSPTSSSRPPAAGRSRPRDLGSTRQSCRSSSAPTSACPVTSGSTPSGT
jgi:NADPH-dependent 2,4-dienoyl-CoA reductase/sulfur reductase-like enzyme